MTGPEPVGPDPDRFEEDVEDPGWPVGFILLLVLAALYLGWRLVEFGIRVAGWIGGG